MARLAVETVVVILIGLAVVVLGALLFSKWGFKADETVSSLITDKYCIQNARMPDFIAKMKAFAPKESPSSEPAYAINVFKDYLTCAYPKTGISAFTQDEVKKDEPQILSCASLAFDNYIAYLTEQKEASKGYPDDIKHYDELLKTAERDKRVFSALFPKSGYSGSKCESSQVEDEHYSFIYGVLKEGIRYDYRFSRITNSWEYSSGSEWKDVKTVNQNTAKSRFFWFLSARLVNVNEDNGADKMIEFFKYQYPENMPDDIIVDGKSIIESLLNPSSGTGNS